MTQLPEWFLDKCIPEPNSGCLIYLGATNEKGYGRIWFFGHNRYAHVISFELANGIIEHENVCHKCDVPCCVNPYHLFDGTQLDNMQDASIKGRMIKGQNSIQAILTDDDIRRIKYLYSIGLSYRELAHIKGVSHTTIDNIINDRKWRHIT